VAYLPQIKVTVNFTDGPVFGYPFTLDSTEHGILGTNVLADNAADVIDVSDQVIKISTKGGFNLIQDKFELSTASVRVLDPDGTLSNRRIRLVDVLVSGADPGCP
jgi:hypothetical protein